MLVLAWHQEYMKSCQPFMVGVKIGMGLTQHTYYETMTQDVSTLLSCTKLKYIHVDLLISQMFSQLVLLHS